jgi:hypothetical protein
MNKVASILGSTCFVLFTVACGDALDKGGGAERVVATASALTTTHTYRFSVPNILASTIRSRSSDTDYGAVAVVVNGQVRATASAFLGNVSGGGRLITNLGVGEISVADTDKITFYVTVANGQPINAADYGARLNALIATTDTSEHPDTEPWSTSGTCDHNFDYQCTSNCQSPPVSWAIDVVGEAACKGVIYPLDELYSFLNPNCNGIVATPSVSFTGATLAAAMQATLDEPNWTAWIATPGTDSSAGCGANSFYQTFIEIDETDGLGPPSKGCPSGLVLCDCISPLLCRTPAACTKACKL